jgi:hypothetical protein
MTQMLLFDAPAALAPAASFPVRTAESTPALTMPAEGGGEREGGLHHMGDLARLVLLRYELVARRRARRAASR